MVGHHCGFGFLDAGIKRAYVARNLSFCTRFATTVFILCDGGFGERALVRVIQKNPTGDAWPELSLKPVSGFDG